MSKLFGADELEDVVHARGRLNILAYLATVEFADFMTLVDEVNLAKGSVGQHLKKLEDAGYVTLKRELLSNRTRTIVKLTRSGREALQQYLEKLQTLLGVVKAANRGKLEG